METWKDWLQAQRNNSKMEVEVLPLMDTLVTHDALTAWQADTEAVKKPKQGWLIMYDCLCNVKWSGAWTFRKEVAHVIGLSKSEDLAGAPEIHLQGGNDFFVATRGEGGKAEMIFFDIPGLRITANREIPSWNQVAIREQGQGALVLITKKGEGDETHFLIAAKPEPGNPTSGFVVLTTPLQASASNLAAAHGGKRPPRAELLDKGAAWTDLPQDGGRYIKKVNRFTVVEAPTDLVAAANERWFTRAELKEAFLNGDLGEHLSQALLLATL